MDVLAHVTPKKGGEGLGHWRPWQKGGINFFFHKQYIVFSWLSWATWNKIFICSRAKKASLLTCTADRNVQMVKHWTSNAQKITGEKVPRSKRTRGKCPSFFQVSLALKLLYCPPPPTLPLLWRPWIYLAWMRALESRKRRNNGGEFRSLITAAAEWRKTFSVKKWGSEWLHPSDKNNNWTTSTGERWLLTPRWINLGASTHNYKPTVRPSLFVERVDSSPVFPLRNLYLRGTMQLTFSLAHSIACSGLVGNWRRVQKATISSFGSYWLLYDSVKCGTTTCTWPFGPKVPDSIRAFLLLTQRLKDRGEEKIRGVDKRENADNGSGA